VDDAMVGVSSGPWAIARGSSVATPSTGHPAVPAPAGAAAPATGGSAAMPAAASSSSGERGFALDPERADRLLRRAVWIGAAILALVILAAIIAAVTAPPGPG
jgi:hypothetical protein